jgi:hypothetical protein
MDGHIVHDVDKHLDLVDHFVAESLGFRGQF